MKGHYEIKGPNLTHRWYVALECIYPSLLDIWCHWDLLNSVVHIKVECFFEGMFSESQQCSVQTCNSISDLLDVVIVRQA